MSERCPLSSLNEEQEWKLTISSHLWEPYIPDECYGCVNAARAGQLGKTTVENIDVDGEDYPEGQDRYFDIGLRPLDKSRREIMIQAGYEDGLGEVETLDYAETTVFVCPVAEGGV